MFKIKKILEDNNNQNIYKIIIIPFILNLISKITENSFLTIVLRCKNVSFIILYISSLFSSFILNLFFIVLGLSFRYLIKTEIINTFFLIVVFILYGIMALIQTCRVFSKRGEEDNKLIDYVINSSSSDEDSERPIIHINSDKNEVEIELDTIKLDEIDDERRNNNFKHLRKKGINNDKMKSYDINWEKFIGCLKMIITAEIGEKMQIFNLGLSSNIRKINYLIVGNAFGIFLINLFIIIFGIKILQKHVNNLFHFLEAVVYLGFSAYYIYCIYF